MSVTMGIVLYVIASYIIGLVIYFTDLMSTAFKANDADQAIVTCLAPITMWVVLPTLGLIGPALLLHRIKHGEWPY